MRFIVANFAAELAMARAATPGPHPRLPSHVRTRLAESSAELAVFDREAIIVSDTEAIEERDLSECEILAWAETDAVAALRTKTPNEETETEASWVETLWQLHGDPAATRRCHDRRFWLKLAIARKTTLPETYLVASLAQLRTRLPEVIAYSADKAWIAKAPFGAAGRERVYRWGADFPEDIETRLERLFQRYGELILEPRMPRQLDFGVAGIAHAKGATCFAPHRLQCDDAGVFRGIDLEGVTLAAGELRAVREAAEAAGAALHREGHRGAFGIDGFVYRTATGSRAIHPMCEINARLTFGHVAHAAAAQAGRRR